MSDSVMKQLVFDCAMELLNGSEGMTNEEIGHQLLAIIGRQDEAEEPKTEPKKQEEKIETPFVGYDWNDGMFYPLKTENVVDAIHMAWNYENDVYEAKTEKRIFSGREDNEWNSEMLEPYDLRMIDHQGYRCLQDIKTDEIYKPDWHM